MAEVPATGELGVLPPVPPNKARFAVELLCAALLAMLFLILLGSAILRNHGYTAPSVYEFVRVNFVYMVGLSAIIAFARRVNLCVPGKWREDSISYQAVMSLLSLGLTFLTVQMLVKQGFGDDASSLLGLPEGISHIPIGLFGLGLSVISLARLWAAICRGKA